MTAHNETTKQAAYLIADHLDRILAAGEDLLRLSHSVRGVDGEEAVAINGFVHDCNVLDLATTAALLRAREHAATLGRSGIAFAPLARLFASNTSAILDVVAQISDRDALNFDGNDPLAFLRSRGLIDDDAGCLRTVETIRVTEDYLIAGAIHLGALMDLSASFLDALEVHFDLFPEIEDVATVAGSPAAPGAGTAPVF